MAEPDTGEDGSRFLFGGEARNARFINEDRNGFNAFEARSGEDEAGHQCLAGSLLELPEDKVAERVKYPALLVPLDSLGDVRMVTEDERRSGIDGGAGERLLQRAQAQRVLGAFVDGDDDDVGLPERGGDIDAHLFDIEMGYLVHPQVARQVVTDIASGVGVGEEGEADSVALDYPWGVRLGEIFADARGEDSLSADKVAAVSGANATAIP